MKALILAGGSGTRLWPLSRENNPKQLHSFVGNASLMTQTVERLTPLIDAKDIWIITNGKYANQISEHSPGVPREQIIAEPFPLGTNLAVGLGVIHIAKSDPDALIFIGWADSYIGNDAAFHGAIRSAGQLAPEVDGVILAVPPSYAATGYGYIETGEPIAGHEGAFRLVRFEEKPELERATSFFRGGRHFWNPGISIWKASKLLDLMKEFKPDHYAALQNVVPTIGTPDELSQMEESFRDLDRMAIDHAIFEKATHIAAIPVDLDWNDIGTWSAIYDLRSKDSTNVTRGPVVTVDTDGCLIYSDKRLIATLGVSDLVIVETEDAVLIMHKNETERLKELHAKVKVFGGTKYI